MSGIAGLVDLSGRRPVPAGVLRRMANALAHRGPDAEALFERPGIGLIVRELHVSEPHQSQPFTNPPQTLIAVLDGEFYGEPPAPVMANGQGNQPPAPLIALWEEHGEQALERLRGQFAFALWDDRAERLVLARDRFGVCPLHWTRQGDWLLFASEIKALLASRMAPDRVDLRGLHHVFTFFGLPGPVTCFEGISSLLPGHFLDIRRNPQQVADRAFWQMNFPDQGEEDEGADGKALVDEYQSVLLRAIERRLKAHPPVVAYSSGGLDSSLLLTMARKLRGQPRDAYTFRIVHPRLNETSAADLLANHVGKAPSITDCRPQDILGAFPALVQATDSPAIETSAAALLHLAETVHERGGRVVLTGEGADEWQAGYPWFRIERLLNFLDVIPGVRLSRLGFRSYVRRVHSRQYPWTRARRDYEAAGGGNAWLFPYILLSVAQHRFFSKELRRRLAGHVPYDDLQLPREPMSRWSPLNRSVFMGARVHLTGLHMIYRADRPAARSSIQLRFPFLDEDVYAFLARLHPRWKMNGLRDKHLQRLLAERWLPAGFAQGNKRLIHGPLDAFHRAEPPPWVHQLLGEESLRKTGYFDIRAVQRWGGQVHRMEHGYARMFIEMALVGVISTQLWHHYYFGGGLCELASAGRP